MPQCWYCLKNCLCSIQLCWFECFVRDVLAGRHFPPPPPAVGRSCGVSAWHGPHSEHDLGWRSAADADDLCHCSGFQGSALAVVLTNPRKPAQTCLRTTHPTTPPCPVVRPGTLLFDYCVFKQQVTGVPPDVVWVVGLCSETACRTWGEPAGNVPNLQVSCPITDIK